MDAAPGKQKLRVKELFESCAWAAEPTQSDIVSAIVTWWLRRNHSDGRRVGARQPERIMDAACGHGLVGMLLSHCFPDSAVCAVDREERKLMRVALSTWQQSGRCLDNFQFRLGDLLQEGSQWLGGSLGARDPADPAPNTLVVGVHACNQATLDVLELATRFGTSWAVVPCCMRKEKFFPGGTTHLDRDEHYPVMCGGLCAKFDADMLHSIDRLISTKNLIIAKRAPRPQTSARGR
ncbi:sirt2 [Symbiodinium natans]|uniref:Sirt2 protein n=1 Tax=Symbiodinium natans TaxID=878477 RepID=A0A812HYU7_9DINO|nr:sirt2 [Symbiodinium natans]